MEDLQKANFWKRVSAAMFDGILLGILVIGVALLLSTLFGYDSRADDLQAAYDRYAEQYEVSFDLAASNYEAMEAEEKARYDAALAAMAEDGEVNYLYGMLMNLTLLIVTFSVLIAFLLLEFAVPLLFGNGQTLGKKVFGIGVMRADGVKLSPVLLFARTVLGKYTVETMIPVLTGIMIYFGVMGFGGTLIILALTAVQLLLLALTAARTPIHDKLAQTVTVDMASQRIFDTPEAREAWRAVQQAASEGAAEN